MSGRATLHDYNVLVERGVDSANRALDGQPGPRSLAAALFMLAFFGELLFDVGSLLERRYRANPLQLWGPPSSGPGVH